MSATTVIDASVMRQMFIAGANNLSNNKEYINELNVFPVPDGDTGTNMTLTIMAAAYDVQAMTEPTVDAIAKAVKSGSLRGARGNSGVILSQLFRGFCKDIKGKTEIDVNDIASGFDRAVETAYKAVMKPKEGTILTVAREMSEEAAELVCVEEDIEAFLEKVIAHGEDALSRTPDMLPVLKEAGVVDSGGQGLIEIMKGFLMGLRGEHIELVTDRPVHLQRGAGLLEAVPKARPVYDAKIDGISTSDIKFTYCTEFIIMLEKELSDEEVQSIKDYMLSIGDSLVCVADDELVKIHIHTNHPGDAFEKALTYGQLTRCKIDNMREEHSERLEKETLDERTQSEELRKIKVEMGSREATESVTPDDSSERKTYGVLAVVSGTGISDIFKKIGADYIIEGGQTMNPSTDDILTAVDRINAEHIFVLPNNKNIILAANQAATISKDKQLHVIGTCTIPQGVSALLAFNAETPVEDLDSMIAEMQEASASVMTGEVTFAVRDTSVDGHEIHKDDIMGISDKGIEVVGEDVSAVTEELIGKLVTDDSGLVTIYYGADVSSDAAEMLSGRISEKYPDVDVDLHSGGQQLYYYIVSVE